MKITQNTLYFFILLFLYILTQPGCSNNPENNSPTPQLHPAIEGTFIQDYLVASWDDYRWEKEYKALAEAGMKYLILMQTVYTGKNGETTSIYPSTLSGVKTKYAVDIVDNCLRNAKKFGFKVFLGLNFNEKWWDADYAPEWIYEQMQIGNKVAEELVHQYKNQYGETMYGWYWQWEVDNLHTKTQKEQEVLAQALNVNLDYLHQKTPKMPILLSPFMNYKLGSAKEYGQIWTNVFNKTNFKEGDIFAPQDCIGAGGLTLDVLDEWFNALSQAVKTQPGLIYWGNIETFNQFWTTASLSRLVQQMKIEKKYVSNFISFAYSHYNSPDYVNPLIHQTYIYYVKNGKLPQHAIPQPVKNLSYDKNTNPICISWEEPDEHKKIMGYAIYLNGTQIGDLQYNHDFVCKTQFTAREFNTHNKLKITVYAYNYNGEKSEKRELIIP